MILAAVFADEQKPHVRHRYQRKITRSSRFGRIAYPRSGAATKCVLADAHPRES
jgi:hypothetical protein